MINRRKLITTVILSSLMVIPLSKKRILTGMDTFEDVRIPESDFFKAFKGHPFEMYTVDLYSLLHGNGYVVDKDWIYVSCRESDAVKAKNRMFYFTYVTSPKNNHHLGVCVESMPNFKVEV